MDELDNRLKAVSMVYPSSTSELTEEHETTEPKYERDANQCTFHMNELNLIGISK